MTEVVKVAITGVMAAICAVIIRKQVPELAVLLIICTGTMVLIYCIDALTTILGFVDELIEIGGIIPELIAPVLKITGIGMVTRFAADFCKDAKEETVSTAVETAGTILSLYSAIPLMSSVVGLIGDLL